MIWHLRLLAAAFGYQRVDEFVTDAIIAGLGIFITAFLVTSLQALS
jgi:hypothetical protein